MLAESIFHAATKYPSESRGGICVASVGSKSGDAGTQEDVGPQTVFAVVEVDHEVSQILIGIEVEHLLVSTSVYGPGNGTGLIVIPDEIDAGVLVEQVGCANAVVQPILHVEIVVKASR